MIVDTSVLIAILKRESGWESLSGAIGAADRATLSSANYLEAGIVVDNWNNPVLSQRLDELIFELDIVIEPVTPEHARIARQACRDYGKGSGHRANLNYGDCFSYALARVSREPLLFKGDDFVHTDLRSALDD